MEIVGQACWMGDGDKAVHPLLHRGSASHNDRRETNNCHGDGGSQAPGCGGGVMTEEVDRRGKRRAERQDKTVCVGGESAKINSNIVL